MSIFSFTNVILFNLLFFYSNSHGHIRLYLFSSPFQYNIYNIIFFNCFFLFLFVSRLSIANIYFCQHNSPPSPFFYPSLSQHIHVNLFLSHFQYNSEPIFGQLFLFYSSLSHIYQCQSFP